VKGEQRSLTDFYTFGATETNQTLTVNESKTASIFLKDGSYSLAGSLNVGASIGSCVTCIGNDAVSQFFASLSELFPPPGGVPDSARAGFTYGLTANAVQPAASEFSLSSGGSTLTVNSAGEITSWTVGGASQLFAAGPRFRVGDFGTEQSFGSLTLVNTVQPDADTLGLSYTRTGSGPLEASILYNLTHPSANRTIVTETMRIVNTGTAPLLFNLFQFNDFDLAGTPGDSTTAGEGVDRLKQRDGDSALDGFVDQAFLVGDGAVPTTLQIDDYLSLAQMLGFIGTDVDTTTLLSRAEPVTGDAAWAWQWRVTIPPSDRPFFVNLRYINDIPEPNTLSLFLISLFGALLLKKPPSDRPALLALSVVK
jgi:hypothetical protein